MLLRALVVCVIAFALACPAAAQAPPADAKSAPQVDKPDARRVGKRHGKGKRRGERPLRRIRRSSVGAPASIAVYPATRGDTADGDDVPPPAGGPRLVPGRKHHLLATIPSPPSLNEKSLHRGTGNLGAPAALW